MAELVLALLLWITIETGLAMPPPPPVLTISREEMAERSLRTTDVKGLYDRETGTIYMLDGWSSANLHGRASLLHELVHHTQAFNKVPSECAAKQELQAYNLSLQWLRHQGVADPYAVLEVDDLTIAVIAMCHAEG
jgi:hypothetical protein